jgi:hypothetical protein
MGENKLIDETEIQDTFYGMLLDIVFHEQDKTQQPVDLNNHDTIQYLIKQLLEYVCLRYNTFVTINKNHVTASNVPESYRELFILLQELKQLLSSRQLIDQHQAINSTYSKIFKNLEQKQTFKPMIANLKQFYSQCNVMHETKQIISINTIRDTFYNIMVDQVIDSKLIPINDLKCNEPYIFFAMSGFVIIESVVRSAGTSGIKLCNQGIGPAQYMKFFEIMIGLKHTMQRLKLNDNQVQLIKLLCMQNQSIQIPGPLKQYQTRELMEVVTVITDMTINISQIDHFKRIIDDVINFCIDALA